MSEKKPYNFEERQEESVEKEKADGLEEAQEKHEEIEELYYRQVDEAGKRYTPKELAKIETTRTISDAELLKSGAHYEVDAETEEKKLVVSSEQIQQINETIETMLAEGIITQEALNNGDIEIHIEGQDPSWIEYDFEVEKEQRIEVDATNFQVLNWKNHVIDTYDQSGRCRIRLKNDEPRLSLKIPLLSQDTDKAKCCIRLEFKPRNKKQAEELLEIKELISTEPGTKIHEKWGTPMKLNNGEKMWLNKDEQGKYWIETDEGYDIKDLLPEGVVYLRHVKSKINVEEDKLPHQENHSTSDQRSHEIEQQIIEAHEKKEYRPVAVGIIKDRNGRILFVQSSKNQNDWYFPQGGIDAGESVVDGLFRELSEEAGMQEEQLEIVGYQGAEDLDAETGREDKRGFAKGKKYFFFDVNYVGPEELNIEKSELANYKWVEKDHAREILATSRPEKRAIMLRALDQV